MASTRSTPFGELLRRARKAAGLSIEAGVAPARAALGEAGWVAAYAEGRALSMEDAIAEALGEGGEGVP